MRIAIDIDGVIADFVGFYLPKLQKYCKCEFEDIVSFNFWKNLDIDKAKYDSIWETEVVNSNIYRELKLIEGSVEALKKLKKNNELILISSRSKQSAEDTINWLRHYCIPFSSLELVGEDERRKVAKMVECDLVVEDNLAIARMVEARGVPVLLFDYPWNRIGKNIKRIKNWNDVVKNVARIKNKLIIKN